MTLNINQASFNNGAFFLYIRDMKFIKQNWRYILLWACIAAITQVFVENFDTIFSGYYTGFREAYWFLTLVVPTLVLLIITWKKK